MKLLYATHPCGQRMAVVPQAINAIVECLDMEGKPTNEVFLELDSGRALQIKCGFEHACDTLKAVLQP